ncbi:UNVERIFIED_CONTAM: protein SEH1 [Sesamum angustifolium]|uniref:Protein SEH1 n=1 Tax=Sesamum angustifolium TaxID=2727405 RepID=A0AAW2MIJ2_9LAMI
MDKNILTLDKGTRCTAWNYSGQRLAAGLVDGSLLIYDSTDPASSTFISTSRFKVQESSILKVVWVPPEYGDAVACIGADGTLSLWEEVTEGHHWKLCKCFDRNTSQVLDIRFGDAQTCLKLVWEFDLDHQRWLPVAELSLPEDKTDQVSAVAWAPNIGRPYELIAVATQKGISIWHLGSNPDADGRLSAQKLATLSGHDSEVWEMEWDMSGTTLATTGSDGVVRLWQSNLNGVWHEQAVLTPAS